jgi:hypothetical protein
LISWPKPAKPFSRKLSIRGYVLGVMGGTIGFWLIWFAWIVAIGPSQDELGFWVLLGLIISPITGVANILFCFPILVIVNILSSKSSLKNIMYRILICILCVIICAYCDLILLDLSTGGYKNWTSFPLYFDFKWRQTLSLWPLLCGSAFVGGFLSWIAD